MSERQNVLWIQTDEQRPDSLGCYGSDWTRTPNIDALAEGGSVFRECYVQSPMCVPSRTSQLSGRYPQDLGVYSNHPFDVEGVLPTDLKMVPNLFADAGYRTASLGKWHTPRHDTWQELHDFPFFLQIADPLTVHPPFTDRGQRVIKNPGSFQAAAKTPVIIGGTYPHHDWGDDPAQHLTDLSIEWLRHTARSGEPFFLRVSYLWPHTPVLVPEPWDRCYQPDEVPCRALDDVALRDRAAYDRRLAAVEQGMDLPLESWRRAAADYYGLCAYLDHQVGRLVRTLEQLEILDETIVAFSADHGRGMGEVGLCQKGTYDREVWRVPLVLSGTGTRDGVRTDLCELVDFGRTLCGLVGIEPDPAMRGRDLFASTEPDAVFGVVDMYEDRRAGVRTRRYRYDCTVSSSGRATPPNERDPNLFDLFEDPNETVNLARDPSMAAVVADMNDRVDAWLARGAR